MHEVIGHASGKLNPGVGTPRETLKNYANTLEEARSDLVALYYLMDEKLLELGVMSTLDVGKTAYDGFIRNGLLWQLRRLQPGEDIEESHMRNRQLVALWAYKNGNAIAEKTRNGKTYYEITDYKQLRDLFGQLLREIQRIKSAGDYAAGRTLVETYGIKVDRELHAEVLKRHRKLNIAPYSGFINPKLSPVTRNGEIIDVEIEYPSDFTEQMLFYAEEYSFLPTYN
jgi:dipeptidyl-peptidase-3